MLKKRKKSRNEFQVPEKLIGGRNPPYLFHDAETVKKSITKRQKHESDYS